MTIKILPLSLFFLLIIVGSGSHADAAACTYDEAILALKQGNEIRGLALLKMAANDGDSRANQYLASRLTEKSSSQLTLQQSLQQQNNLLAFKKIDK